MKAQQLERRVMHTLEYGTIARKLVTVAAPAAVAALAVLGGTGRRRTASRGNRSK